MKQVTHIFLFGLLVFLWQSCTPDPDTIPSALTDCVFIESPDDKDGLLDENESEILDEIHDNSLTSDDLISENLLGEWSISGFAAGWIASKTQPCGYLIFKEDELFFEFHDAYIDTVYTHTWSIENNYLKLTPTNPYLEMSKFHESYMYGPHFIADADIYIYEKIR